MAVPFKNYKTFPKSATIPKILMGVNARITNVFPIKKTLKF
jgi:hypothetical protein